MISLPSDAHSLTDDGPFITELIMEWKQFFLLLGLPILSIDVGIKVIIVSLLMKCLPLSTLFACSPQES